jgi:Tfp pilus assembly protein PilX
MKPNPHSRRGSVLLITMILVGVLSLSVVSYFQNLVPKFRGSYQGAAWHEALHGAEAGADYALRQLNSWATTTSDPTAYPWTTNSWSYTDATYQTNGERSLDGSQLPFLGGQSNVRVTKITADVYTRENSGSSASLNPWFRIRSTARADLPGKYVSADRRDIQLRRMKLAAKTGTGAADPNVTRTVEIIARPRYAFSRAIVTLNNMSLGNSATWTVDSFDSQDPTKSMTGTSAGGLYPGAGDPKVQSNGSIASTRTNPTTSPYGPLISGNSATVLGSVQTNGGDDPSTPTTFENVSGNTGMDQTRISADFNQTIVSPTAPMWSSWTYQGPAPGSFTTGSKAAPTRYAITGNLGTFAVTPPATGTGYIEIIVTGNLSTGNGGGAGITIPPNVYASIWVNGDINLGNGNINSNSSSSQVASHLTVYGTGNAGNLTTTESDDDAFVASGNANLILGLYAPNYVATLNGTVDTVGAFVVRSFYISGGGNGGFHYDENLGKSGPINGWDVASNFEDTRGDL